MADGLALFIDGAVMALEVYKVDADRYSTPGNL